MADDLTQPAREATELTEPAKRAIRAYMVKLVVPTGVALSIISAVGGYLLNEVARGAAYAKAYGDAMSSVIRTTSDATSARVRAEESARAAAEKGQEAKDKVEQLNKNIDAANSMTRSFLNNVESVSQDPKLVEAVSANLTQSLNKILTVVRLGSGGPLGPNQPDEPLRPTPGGEAMEIPGSENLSHCAIVGFWNRSSEEYCNLSRNANGRWAAGVSGRVACKVSCLRFSKP